ncbi:MAG: archaemetzincin family Zn-dependent metalloprotease [Candidatus Marinimicrobia bacterium]|nr:archaemetzincin family Zn-dependent metalloprotease [FCB group bacterium]MBL7024594.1 archaemetzincin family Zn-dependent metalloprotease [Candidatus Neomarinimicrobiota bacterium]
MSRIRIIPLQFAGVEVLEQMIPPISARFKMETLVSAHRFDLTPFFDPVRSQYNANDIIQKLVPLTDEGDKIVGVTDLDLFIPVLSYIFGQAYLGGSVALISGHRLENARYGMTNDPKLFSERLLKCIIHELGHTFGLKHCLLPGCVMTSTTYVEEMDQKSDQFCRNCKIQLK